MNILNDILLFFQILSLVDVVFLIAIIVLLILIVTLIYFIRINKDVLDEDDIFSEINKVEIQEENKNEVVNIIEKIESVPVSNSISDLEYNDEEGELLDLESLTKKLKEEESNDRINCTEYEKDQEEKEIISYDELLQKRNKYALNYEKEEVIDDLIVKKVNINDLENKNEEEVVSSEIRVISYQKEEAFLDALKELNKLLN